MLIRWLRYALWRPYELGCRRFPLVPLRATVTHPVKDVTCIRIDNIVTQSLGRFAGYDYSVCYLIDGSILVDTGFPWARRAMKKVLIELGVDKSLRYVVNTHYHEDHVGNNDLLSEISRAEILAHSLAIPEIRFPSEMAWYRRFLFGPVKGFDVLPVRDRINTEHYAFDIDHFPGHCPGHICLFEPRERWLFSGDLYIAADLDSQLSDANGPEWIASLNKAIELRPKCMFDAHGAVFTSEDEVHSLLIRKRDFLIGLRERVTAASKEALTIQELTRRVFQKRDWVNALSFSDGWLSLITGSDFSRGNLIKSFLREQQNKDATPTTLR